MLEDQKGFQPPLQQQDQHQKRSTSDYVNDYKNIVKFDDIALNNSIEEYQKAFHHCGIQYSPQKQFHQNIQIQIFSSSINQQALIVSVKWGYFTTKLSLLIVDRLFNCSYLSIGGGKNSNIYLSQIDSVQFAVKVIKFNASNEQQMKLNAIKECFIMKVASALKIGPKYFNMGFDMIVYDGCIKFAMEKCSPVSQVQNNIKLQQCQILRQSLRVLHHFDIFHFDIKIDNIMFSPFYDRFVFIDFGLSQILNTKLGQFVKISARGTLYMCYKQMQKGLINSKNSWIDPYYNDAYSLNISIQVIKKLQIQYQDQARDSLFNNLMTSYQQLIEKQSLQNHSLVYLINYLIFIEDTQRLVLVLKYIKPHSYKFITYKALQFLAQVYPNEKIKMIYNLNCFKRFHDSINFQHLQLRFHQNKLFYYFQHNRQKTHSNKAKIQCIKNDYKMYLQSKQMIINYLQKIELEYIQKDLILLVQFLSYTNNIDKVNQQDRQRVSIKFYNKISLQLSFKNKNNNTNVEQQKLQNQSDVKLKLKIQNITKDNKTDQCIDYVAKTFQFILIWYTKQQNYKNMMTEGSKHQITQEQRMNTLQTLIQHAFMFSMTTFDDIIPIFSKIISLYYQKDQQKIYLLFYIGICSIWLCERIKAIQEQYKMAISWVLLKLEEINANIKYEKTIKFMMNHLKGNYNYQNCDQFEKISFKRLQNILRLSQMQKNCFDQLKGNKNIIKKFLQQYNKIFMIKSSPFLLTAIKMYILYWQINDAIQVIQIFKRNFNSVNKLRQFVIGYFCEMFYLQKETQQKIISLFQEYMNKVSKIIYIRHHLYNFHIFTIFLQLCLFQKSINQFKHHPCKLVFIQYIDTIQAYLQNYNTQLLNNQQKIDSGNIRYFLCLIDQINKVNLKIIKLKNTTHEIKQLLINKIQQNKQEISCFQQNQLLIITKLLYQQQLIIHLCKNKIFNSIFQKRFIFNNQNISKILKILLKIYQNQSENDNNGDSYRIKTKQFENIKLQLNEKNSYVSIFYLFDKSINRVSMALLCSYNEQYQQKYKGIELLYRLSCQNRDYSIYLKIQYQQSAQLLYKTMQIIYSKISLEEFVNFTLIQLNQINASLYYSNSFRIYLAFKQTIMRIIDKNYIFELIRQNKMGQNSLVIILYIALIKKLKKDYQLYIIRMFGKYHQQITKYQTKTFLLQLYYKFILSQSNILEMNKRKRQSILKKLYRLARYPQTKRQVFLNDDNPHKLNLLYEKMHKCYNIFGQEQLKKNKLDLTIKFKSKYKIYIKKIVNSIISLKQ